MAKVDLKLFNKVPTLRLANIANSRRHHNVDKKVEDFTKVESKEAFGFKKLACQSLDHS